MQFKIIPDFQCKGKKKSKNSDKITGKVRIFSVLFGRNNSLPFFLASSSLKWNKQQQVNNQKTLSDYFFSLMCCLYARPGKSCWGIFWTWLKLLYKKNKQLCRNLCTLCSATSERANPALPTPTWVFWFSRHHLLPEQLPGHPTPASFLVKNHPSAGCQLLWKFSRPFSWTVPVPYTHNSSVLLRWLQPIFYLLSDSISFTGVCCRNTLFWRGSLHNSWKAQHHIASPWMLAFWEEFPSGWDRARKFGLPDTHTRLFLMCSGKILVSRL